MALCCRIRAVQRLLAAYRAARHAAFSIPLQDAMPGSHSTEEYLMSPNNEAVRDGEYKIIDEITCLEHWPELKYWDKPGRNGAFCG